MRTEEPWLNTIPPVYGVAIGKWNLDYNKVCRLHVLLWEDIVC